MKTVDIVWKVYYINFMSELLGHGNEAEQAPQEYRVTPISPEPEEQAKRGWKAEINGKEFEGPVESVRIYNPNMNVEVAYGKRPEGYDGPVLKEPGGGGAVTVPYYYEDGQLYVAMVEEVRPTCTDGIPEKVLNVPRGFLDPGQTHFETAKRELGEETGYEPLEKRIKELEGQPMNPNSTFFVTGKGKGVHTYGVRVYDFEIIQANQTNNPMEREYTFDKDLLHPTTKIGEKISGCKFVHWTKAVQQPDMFTAAAVGRILASQN